MNYNDEIRTRNMMKFLGWLQTFDPDMHALVVERIGEAPPNDSLTRNAAQLNGLGQFDFSNIFGGGDTAPANGTATTKPWWESGIDAIKSVATGALQYKTQKDLIDLQMSRIEQGKPPIDTALISPTVRVQADLPPAIQEDIRDMKRTVILGIGGVVAAIIAFMMLRKR
jgi:hypothetical protein